MNACRYHTLVAVQSLAGQLKAEAVSGAGAERARPLVEVMINTPPTPPQEEFADDLQSWSGAAEVSDWLLSFCASRRRSHRTSNRDSLHQLRIWQQSSTGVA